MKILTNKKYKEFIDGEEDDLKYITSLQQQLSKARNLNAELKHENIYLLEKNEKHLKRIRKLRLQINELKGGKQ